MMSGEKVCRPTGERDCKTQLAQIRNKRRLCSKRASIRLTPPRINYRADYNGLLVNVR